ncbi:A disintegrin and metalloproteinase with thrombospondin motifs 20-like [Mytilus trossulus]|uniref:A disintegrin and metalloproteinase with thrombospondin motifs 20-like n=1 Tax=Mytilus trossulus TaxID=6551 RepID=UPI0030047A3A
MRLDILFFITLPACTVVNSFCIGTQTYLCTQRSSSYVYYTTECGFLNWERCGRSRKYYDHSYKRCTRSCPPVDGKWGSWISSSSWSKCTNSCGSGHQVRKRTRSCDNPEPNNGGRQCYGLKTGEENRYCHHNPCPVDVNGGWSPYGNWSSWTSCTVPCDRSTKSRGRNRECSNPEPKYGGKQCVGSPNETVTLPCNAKACLVDGDWKDNSQWSPWGTCNVTCGGGFYSRYRNKICENPDHKYGVMNCSGSNTERQKSTCNTQGCISSGLYYVIIPGTLIPLLVAIIVCVIVRKKKRNRTNATTHCIQNVAYMKSGRDNSTSEDKQISHKLEEKQITDGKIENLYLNTNNNLNCSSNNDQGDNTYDYAEEEDHFDKNVDDDDLYEEITVRC